MCGCNKVIITPAFNCNCKCENPFCCKPKRKPCFHEYSCGCNFGFNLCRRHKEHDRHDRDFGKGDDREFDRDFGHDWNNGYWKDNDRDFYDRKDNKNFDGFGFCNNNYYNY